MKIRSLLVCVAVFALVMSFVSQPLSACEKCKFWLYCYGQDCQIIQSCESTSFPSGGFTDCEVVYGICNTGGQLCRWA